MGLKRKEILIRQKTSREQELKDRLAVLAKKGVTPPKTDKDPLVRKLKAEVKDSTRRLARIAEIDKRTEAMARIKAEKAAAPKKEEEGAKAPKPKSGPQEGKAKKPKAPEGGKPPKKAESPEGGKAPAPKKAEKPKEEPVIS